MKTSVLLFCFTVLLACKNNTEKAELSNTATNKVSAKAAVVIEMEGETYTIHQKDINPFDLNFVDGKLRYTIYANDSPIQVNFILKDAELLNKGSKTYTIPEDNAGTIKADLSLYNKNRDASRLNKQVVFRKGIIEIAEVTQHILVMTFKGEASGVTDSKNSFPISGSININY